MIALLRNRLLTQNGKEILELGAGYHEDFREIVASQNNYTISDCNLSELPRLPSSKLLIIKADACATNFPGKAFDLVCSSMLITHIPIKEHIHEVRRLLKNDGLYWAAITGWNHNKELKAMGFDPGIDIGNTELQQMGFTIIDEEQQYREFESKQQEIEYFRKIGCIMKDETNHPKGLTSHFLLFELKA